MAVRVLVVDDAAFMRMMVKDILSKNGYEVVGEAERTEVVSGYAGGQDVVLRVLLDAPDGPADAVSIHGTYLYKAESQVVKVVVELSVQVETGA